jgi:hypothetical protein
MQHGFREPSGATLPNRDRTINRPSTVVLVPRRRVCAVRPREGDRVPVPGR